MTFVEPARDLFYLGKLDFPGTGAPHRVAGARMVACTECCGSYTECCVSRTECCGWGNRPPHPLQNMPSTSSKGGKRELGMGMGAGPNFSYNILNPKWTARAQLRKRTQRVQPKPTNGMLFASILMYIRNKFSIQSDTDAQSYGPHKSTMPSRAQTAKIH